MSALDLAPDGGTGHRLGADDRLEILKLQALWTAVVRAGVPERAAEFCADDVIVLPPNAPPIAGKAAARDWLRGSNGPPIERVEVQGVDLRGGPQSAWLTATITTHRRDETGAATQECELRLWALVKDNKIWRVRLAGWEPVPESTQNGPTPN